MVKRLIDNCKRKREECGIFTREMVFSNKNYTDSDTEVVLDSKHKYILSCRTRLFVTFVCLSSEQTYDQF